MESELDRGIAKHVDLFSQPSRAITAGGSTTRRLVGLFAIRFNGKERNRFTLGRIGRQHGVIPFLGCRLMTSDCRQFQGRLLQDSA